MKEYIAEYIIPVEKKGRNYELDFLNATQLIRCKECRMRKDPTYRFGFCMFWNTETRDDGFCHHGEREPEE